MVLGSYLSGFLLRISSGGQIWHVIPFSKFIFSLITLRGKLRFPSPFSTPHLIIVLTLNLSHIRGVSKDVQLHRHSTETSRSCQILSRRKLSSEWVTLPFSTKPQPRSMAPQIHKPSFASTVLTLECPDGRISNFLFTASLANYVLGLQRIDFNNHIQMLYEQIICPCSTIKLGAHIIYTLKSACPLSGSSYKVDSRLTLDVFLHQYLLYIQAGPLTGLS